MKFRHYKFFFATLNLIVLNFSIALECQMLNAKFVSNNSQIYAGSTNINYLKRFSEK